jgi:hypothetical protein
MGCLFDIPTDNILKRKSMMIKLLVTMLFITYMLLMILHSKREPVTLKGRSFFLC